MDELVKKLVDKIIDELAEKGKAEVEIRGTLNAQGNKIHNLELNLKDKADDCELDPLRDRVTKLEEWKRQREKAIENKNKYIIAWIAILGTVIAGLFELVKYLIIKE